MPSTMRVRVGAAVIAVSTIIATVAACASTVPDKPAVRPTCEVALPAAWQEALTLPPLSC